VDLGEAAVAHVAGLSSGPPLDPSLRVTLHFHPDRSFDGVSLVEVLAREGVYRSQFETGTSNGGLTAHAGGDRWQWESRIFGGVYDAAPVASRPKYGSLNHRRRPAGGSPRFGSAHLRLRPETLARTTFCYPDSFFSPTHFGVAERMGLVELAEADDQDYLDDYIEAHVHGGLRLSEDVEALVLDPCYRDTPVESAAASLPCEVEWHHGFALTVDELARHPDYRGPSIVTAGCEIAENGMLNARIVGEAARVGRHDPRTLKRVWHYIARFGGSRSGGN